MSILHKEYHKIPETAKSKYAGKQIKFSVSFNRDQYNWASSQRKQIGYQVTVVPVEISADGRIESYSAFSGFNDCLLPIERQSKKRLEKAIEILQENKERYLNYFIEKEELV